MYWFTWLVEHDLDSGFICTDSDDLIRRYVADINRVKAAEPGAVLAMLSQAEQLNGSMLSEAGNRFTRERYLRDYEHLFANGYAAFSSTNYSKVRPLLEAKYAKSLPSP